ncbi:hypothetical protein LTT66_24920 [Nocardia gipuzkoensis]|nr:hypothetical protein [Nocardia gipuzkoensis]UGT66504.1 hypothetical protein LTT66_24920 [Nocardia gipuzkoensis]
MALLLPLLPLALLPLPRVFCRRWRGRWAVNRADAAAGRVAGWRQLSIH